MNRRGHMLSWLGALLLLLLLMPTAVSAGVLSLGTPPTNGAPPSVFPLGGGDGVVTSWYARGNYRIGTLRGSGGLTDVQLVASPSMQVATFSQNIGRNGAGVLIWEGNAPSAMHHRSPYFDNPGLLSPYYGIFLRHRSPRGELGPPIKVADTYDPQNVYVGDRPPLAVPASSGRWLILWGVPGTFRARIVNPDNSLGRIQDVHGGIVVPHRASGAISIVATGRVGTRCSIKLTTVRAGSDIDTRTTSRIVPRCPTELEAAETSNGNLMLAWVDRVRSLRRPCGEVSVRAAVVVAQASAARRMIGPPRRVGRSAEIMPRLVERPTVAVAGFTDGRATVAWVGPRVLARTIARNGAPRATIALSPPGRVSSGVAAVGSAQRGLVAWIENGLETVRCRSAPPRRVVARSIKPGARAGARYAYPGTVLADVVPVVRPNGAPLALTWVGQRNSIALLSRP